MPGPWLRSVRRADDARPAQNLGLVYSPRLPRQPTTTSPVSKERRGDPWKNPADPHASTSVNPPR